MLVEGEVTEPRATLQPKAYEGKSLAQEDGRSPMAVPVVFHAAVSIY